MEKLVKTNFRHFLTTVASCPSAVAFYNDAYFSETGERPSASMFPSNTSASALRL